MDEEQLGVLQANGYDYDNGAIIDSEGNYLPSVNLGEYTMNSELSQEDWVSYTESIAETAKNYTDPLKDLNISKKVESFNPENSNNFLSEYKKSNNKIDKYSVTAKNKRDIELSGKDIYTYPIVLLLSLVIFTLIKKIRK